MSERTRINAIEITYTGENGGPRIALPLSIVHTLPSGKEIAEPAATVAHNVAELLHDDEAAKVFPAFFALMDRIASGDLKPLPPEHITTPE